MIYSITTRPGHCGATPEEQLFEMDVLVCWLGDIGGVLTPAMVWTVHSAING